MRFITRSADTQFVSFSWKLTDDGREIDSGGYVHPISPLRFNVYLPANGVFQLSLYPRYKRLDATRAGSLYVNFSPLRCASRARDPKCWFID